MNKKLLLIIFTILVSACPLFAAENINSTEYKIIDTLITRILYNDKIKSIPLKQWRKRKHKFLCIDTCHVYSNLREILGNTDWISKGLINEHTYMESLTVENNKDSISNFRASPDFKAIPLINSSKKKLPPGSLILTIFNKYKF